MNNLLAIPAVLGTGILKIATADIVVLVVILVAGAIGYIKGFMKQILSVLGFFASLVLAFLFSDDLAELIYNKIPLITNAVRGVVESLFGSVLGGNLTSEQALLSALGESKIPAFLHEAIANLVVNSNFNIQVVEAVTKWALNVISFLAIIVIANIVFLILKIFFKFVTQIPIIKGVDKTLGVIFSVLKAVVLLVIVCSVLSIFTNINYFLTPEGDVVCVFNKIMELIMNLPFIKNIFG